MSIRTTFKLLFGLILILFLLNAYSLYELNLSMQTTNETSEHRQELKQLGMDLAKGSDYLTNEIRSYVQFGDRSHYDNFLTEINVTKSRDRAVARLKALGVSQEDFDVLQKAKDYSDNLIKKENTAIAAVEKNDFKTARELVFGDYYKEQKSKINGAISKFQESINSKAKIENEKAKDRTSFFKWVSNISLVLSGILVIFSFYFVGIKRLIQPLIKLVNIMKSLASGNTSVEVPDSARNDEIGDMSSTIQIFKDNIVKRLKVEKSADAKQKEVDNQNVFKGGLHALGTAMQGEQEVHKLGDSILNAVLSFLKVPMGAIFIKTSEDVFERVGSVAYPLSEDLPEMIPIGSGLVGQVALSGDYLIVEDVSQFSCITFGFGKVPATSALIYPLFHNEKVVGVLELVSNTHFEESDIVWLAEASQSMGTCIRSGLDLEERRIVEEKLQASEIKTRSIIDNALDAIIVINESGTIQSANPVVENIFGYQVSELIEKNIRLLMPEPYKSEHDTYLENYIKTGKTNILNQTRELKGLRKDGTVFPLDLSVSQMYLDGERYFTGMVRDVSERKEAEDDLRKLSKAVEQSPAIVLITDTEGIIEYVNPKFEEVTGYTVKDAIGKTPRILKSGTQSAETYEKLWETITDGKEWHGQLRNRKKNGDLYWESASISPIKTPDGTITHFLGVKEDITTRKQAEEELTLAKQKAEDATKAKGDFLANMSHEIRTPMNAIIGMSHLALKTDLSAKQQNYINKIQSSSNALLGLINDILDFSKIEAGKLDMESADFHLNEVLDDLSTLVTLKAQDKGLEVLFSIDKDVPYSLVGDSLRLGQILTNLTNNAVKFTEKGEIIVRIKCLKVDSERIELKFSVCDTGIGLTEKQIGNLFQSFSQADTSTSRKYGGTGLGLTISKKLVEMMDGKIWVESEAGKGSSFIFTAGFGVSTHQEKNKLILSDDLKGKKVLIVDDNQMALEVLENSLKSFSLDVSMASSGAEAISMVESADKSQPYELIIMDWQMPEMNGIRASEIIKKHPDLNKIPKIIMLTAYGREEVVRQAEEAKLDGFMVKPMNPSILFENIMEVFGKQISKKNFGKTAGAQQETLGLENICGAEILLVDDNEINQEVATELLEQAGMCVTSACNGKEAVEKVTLSKFDCVLMDIQMPEMDGYEATRAIRKNERFASLPIVAMTANAMQGDREKCIDAGMNDHVAKPINPKQLHLTLIKWIPAREGIKQKTTSSPENTQATQTKEVLPELPGIDVAGALVRVNGNEKLYRKLLRSFYQTNINTRFEIEKALQEGDIKLAERLVHTIKGVSATIGADELAKVSQPLETELRNENVAIDKKLWNAFWDNLNGVLGVVKQLEPQEDEGSCGELDLTKIELPQSLIDSMKEDVRNGMLMELDQYFSTIEKVGPDGKKLADHFKNLASQFDDDGILQVLETIENGSEG